MQTVARLYTRSTVRASSLAENRASSYRISVDRTGEGGEAAWLAEIPELSNCSGRGSTPEEAVRRAWAAAEEIVGQAQEDEPDPQQRASEAQHSGRLLVRMPATLHDELARVAKDEGVSLNQLITGALAAAVEWRGGSKSRSTRIEESDAPHAQALSGQLTRVLLAANLAVVLVAAIVAITLLVAAWRGGW